MSLKPGIAAALYAALLILGSPVAGQIRAALGAAFPADFTRIVGSFVALMIGGAFVAALVRLRERRVVRLAFLGGALAMGVGVAIALPSGSATVDVVERFHFVEYGLLTALWYRTCRARGDASLWAVPLAAGLLVASLDEWLQWLLPSRVGELRDVLLDVASCGSGLLFSLGFELPKRLGALLTLESGSRIRIAAVAGVAVLAAACFFQSVHLGYRITGPEAQTFVSTLSGAELTAASADRAVRWKAAPPLVPRLLSAEDHYLSEALWHVQRRNRAWDAGDLVTAWEENRILEAWFAPVLATPSFYARTGFGWPAAQRLDAEARTRGRLGPYASDAEPYPVRTWPKSIVWAVTLGIVTGLAWWARGFGPEGRHL